MIFMDQLLSAPERKSLGLIGCDFDLPCVGLWPRTPGGLQEAGVDRYRIARHLKHLRHGLHGEARAKVAFTLYDISDAIFYLGSGAHRLGTVDTAMLIYEAETLADEGSEVQVAVGTCLYRVTFAKKSSH